MTPFRALLVCLLMLNSEAGLAQSKAAWAPSWTAAQHRLETDAQLSDNPLTDATLRQAVRLSIGGPRIKIVLSNIAGTEPLVITGVHVAMSGPPGTASIQPQSDHEVRFRNHRTVTIPSHDVAISDAV